MSRLSELSNQLRFKENFQGPIEYVNGDGFSFTEIHNPKYASNYGITTNLRKTKGDLIGLYVTATYGIKTEEGLSLGNIEISLKNPVEITNHENYFFDTKENKFYKDTEETTLQTIFDEIIYQHNKPRMLFYGMWLRIKLLFWWHFLPKLITIIDWILLKLLWVISGETVKEDIISRLWDREEREVEKKDVEFIKGKVIEFFGYEAKRWSVVFYCLLHLIIFIVYFYYFNHSFSLTTRISANNFLSLCYVVVSFSMVEFLIPKLIKDTIKKLTPKAYRIAAFSRVKV